MRPAWATPSWPPCARAVTPSWPGPAPWSRARPRAGGAGDLDDAEYAEAVGHLGPSGLFELLTLVGYYATLALQLRVFRVPAPEDPLHRLTPLRPPTKIGESYFRRTRAS